MPLRLVTATLDIIICFQFAVLLIHGISFLRAFGEHNFEKEAAVRGYHSYILYSVDSHARRGHVTSRVQL